MMWLTIIISDNAKMLKSTEKALSQLHASQEVRAYLETINVNGNLT